MPLILLLPALAVAVFALWVLLLPLAVIQRYRFGKARRRVYPWAVRINAWIAALSVVAFVGSAWVLQHWIDDAIVDALLGLGLGGLVGIVGLALDRFERTAQGVFRTPNRWLVLGLSGLLAARIALGLWLAWSDGVAPGTTTWITHGGVLGVGGVLLGYALATAWGMRFRLARR